MSKFSLLLYIVGILTFCSCDKEDDIQNSRLNGSRSLVEVTCECAPSDLKKGEHIWVFDLNSNEVSVQNLNDKPLQILQTGTYEFDLTDSTIRIKTTT